MKQFSIWRQFQWKIFLLRILANALALSLTVLVLPQIHFVNFSIASLLVITLVLGILNALVRPILQILTIRLLFVSYGLIIVLTNMVILYLLARLVPDRFAVDNLLWAFVAAFLIGALGNFLENLLGVTPPILADEAKELRKHIEEQDVTILEAWLLKRKAARELSETDEQSTAYRQPDSKPEVVEAKSSDAPPEEPAPVTRGEE